MHKLNIQKQIYQVLDNAIEAIEEEYLYTNVSQLPNAGNGLYTAISIFKDEIICYFKGEILSVNETKIRIENKHDQYFICLLNGSIMDSKHTECFAKYANDAEGYGNNILKNNAKITLDEEGNVCLIALKKIKTGEEIFCSYGKKYWEKHGAI